MIYTLKERYFPWKHWRRTVESIFNLWKIKNNYYLYGLVEGYYGLIEVNKYDKVSIISKLPVTALPNLKLFLLINQKRHIWNYSNVMEIFPLTDHWSDLCLCCFDEKDFFSTHRENVHLHLTRHQNQTEQQQQQQHVGVGVSVEEIRTTSSAGDVTENL